MKPCPLCKVSGCAHEKKFFSFGLTKVAIISKSLDTTVDIFSKLATFLATTPEMQYKLNFTFDELRKCQERMHEVKRWYETKSTNAEPRVFSIIS